jgi:glycosyltransferase involved in cell wall biosynthesis
MHTEAPAHRKLRLLQITHDLDLGGLQQVVYNLCRTIDRTRFDVSVLCLREKGRFAPDVEALGIPVLQLEQKTNGVDYLAFTKVARLLKALQIDVIHTHNTQPFIDGTIGALIGRVRTIVHTDHARSFPDKTRYMVAEWAMSQFAYRVVGCSDHTSKQLVAYEKISPRKIRTIVNGIDGSRFDVSIDKSALRRELGIAAEGAVIGLAVRLSDQKGITFLLRAMPAILRQHPQTTLLIAGDGDLQADLQAEARALGIAERVVFCGARKDIPQILKLLDLYVLPSKWEGLPMVILEAMAAGCPVVATDVGGNSSAVVNGKTGVLVPAQDPEALATAVATVLGSQQTRLAYAASGRARFLEKFTAEKMTRQYERLYRREDA